MDYVILKVMKGGKIAVGKSDIAMTHVAQYGYGVPFLLSIFSLSRLDIEVGKEYEVVYKDARQKLLLLETTHEKVGGHEYNKLVLMHKEIAGLLSLDATTSTRVKSISLSDIVEERANQLRRAIFEIRKKASFFVLDAMGEFGISSFQRCTSRAEVQLNAKIVPIDMGKGKVLRRKNYYTQKDGAVTRTTKGKGDPIYLPFVDPKQIRNLDSFIVPRYRLISEATNLKLGDHVSIDNKKMVVVEVEVLSGSNSKAYVIVGNVIE